MALPSPPVTVADVKTKLVGLDPWLCAAAQSDAAYDDARIAREIPAMIRRYERETQFRVNQAQVVANPDGTYNNAGLTTNLAGDMPLVVDAAYPYYRRLAMEEYLVTTLQHRPVQQVQRVRIMLSPTDSLLHLPAPWYRVDGRSGRLWIVPYQGSVLVTTNLIGLTILQAAFAGKDFLPNSIAIDYIAGLPSGWTSNPEWADLRRSLEEYCALAVLNDIGEMFDAGMLSKSISADGAGQSLNYDRFARRKQELQMSVERFQQTLQAQETPFLLGAV